MGTFHSDHGPLHGITVVVDTHGPTVYIGRCHEEHAEGIVLLDVDRYEDGTGGKTKREYIAHAARFGVWKKHDRLTVPRAEISSVRRLGEVSHGGAPRPQP